MRQVEQPAGIGVDTLIPHRPPMRLLDEVLAYDEQNLWAQIAITRQSPFADDSGVRTCVGLEYLAQAAAAFFTLQAGDGDAPRQGMLVACRRFATTQAFIPLASRLLLQVTLTSSMPPAAAAAALVKFHGEVHILQSNTPTPASAAACARVTATRATTVADLSVYL